MKLIMTCWIWCKNGAFWTDYFRFAAKDNCGNKTHLVLQIHKYLKDPKSMLHLLSWNSCFWSKDVISVARGLVCLGFFWQTTIRRNREFRRVETIQVHWKRGRRQCWLSRWLIVGPLFPTRRELIVIVTFKRLFFLHLFKAMFRKTMENHGKPWKTMENPHVWLSWNHPSWKILAFLGFLDSLGPANKLASQRGCRRPTTIFNIFVLKSIKITTVNHYHYNQCPCWSLLNHYILTICPGENWCCWSCGGVWPTGIGEVYSGTISTVTRHSLAWLKMVVFPWKMVVFPLKNGDFP